MEDSDIYNSDGMYDTQPSTQPSDEFLNSQDNYEPSHVELINTLKQSNFKKTYLTKVIYAHSLNKDASQVTYGI